MNIEERMDAVKVAHKMKDGIFIVVEYDKAIRIAKEYAEEMCKRQREICANPPETLASEDDTFVEETFIGLNYIKTAPLATDKDGEEKQQ